MPIDQLLDDHAVEFEECKRWANSDAGQAARMTNPAGFANVRAHAEAHLRVMTAASPPNAASLILPPQSIRLPRVSPPPPSAELHTSSTAAPQHPPREFSSRSDERDGPGDHWVTIDGNHVLIHESRGKQLAENEPLKVTIVLGKEVAISYLWGLQREEKLRISREIAAAVDLLNKNASKLTPDEKKAIAQISSIDVTPDPKKKLGATGSGSITLSARYFENPNVSAAWIGSLIGHEGQHYLNAGKYSGENLWKDEQSASKTQLDIGNKIGFNDNEKHSLRSWMDDKNRAAMQEHMEKGYTY